MRGLVVALVLLSGCSIERFGKGALAVSMLAIACDYGQTRVALASGSANELNPIMGSNPSPAVLTAYNVGLAGLVVAGFIAGREVLGERWQWISPVTSLMIEIPTINYNMITAPKPVCGLM